MCDFSHYQLTTSIHRRLLCLDALFGLVFKSIIIKLKFDTLMSEQLSVLNKSLDEGQYWY